MNDPWLIFSLLAILWPLGWLIVFVFNLDLRLTRWIRKRRRSGNLKEKSRE